MHLKTKTSWKSSLRARRNKPKVGTNPLKTDPTRTTTLRRAFVTELYKRFARLKGKIVKLISGEDALGLEKLVGTRNVSTVADLDNPITLNILSSPYTLSWEERQGIGPLVGNSNPNHDERGRFASSPFGQLHGRLHNELEKLRTDYDNLLASRRGHATAELAKALQAKINALGSQRHKAKDRAEAAKEAWKDLKALGYDKDTIQDVTEAHIVGIKRGIAATLGRHDPEHDDVTSLANDVLDHYDYDPDNRVHNSESLVTHGENCGTGAGGFQPGNTCGKGGGSGEGGDRSILPPNPKTPTDVKVEIPFHLPPRTIAVTKEVVKRFLGGNLQKAAGLVGAQPGANIRLSSWESGHLMIEVDHPKYHASRTIEIDDDGNKIMSNDSFGLMSGVPKGTGIGLQVFSDQVEHLRAEGFKYIKLDAARGATMNGHYSWARMGCDAKVDDINKGSIRRIVEERFPNATHISDLMTTKEDRDWWKGNGDSVKMKFDLTEGSRSLRILYAYQDEMRKERGGKLTKNVDESVTNEPEHTGEEIELTPEDEDALDKAWERVIEEEKQRKEKGTTENFNPDHDELGKFASSPFGKLHGELEDKAKELRQKIDDLKDPKEHKKLTKEWNETGTKARYAKEVWKSLKQMGYHKDNIHEITEKDQNDLKDHLASYTGLKPEDSRVTSALNDAYDHYDYDPDNPVHNTTNSNGLVVPRFSQGTPTGNTRWADLTDAERVEAFQDWLQEQFDEEGITGLSGEELWERFTTEGFKRGQGRAFDDLSKSQLAGAINDRDKTMFYQGNREQFLRSSFGQPVATEKVKLLAGRSFDELEGLTSEMGLKMSRILTDGLVTGANPRDIAKGLVDQVDLSRTKAELIAQTEIIRAHNEGQLIALQQLGVEEVGVMVEWLTAGFGVCPECEMMEGVVLTLEEAKGLLPKHPRCRCCWLPANVGESKKDQIRGKEDIEDTMDEAYDEDEYTPDIDEERPEDQVGELMGDEEGDEEGLADNTTNAEWDETLHPRDAVGKFSVGGGGGGHGVDPNRPPPSPIGRPNLARLPYGLKELPKEPQVVHPLPKKEAAKFALASSKEIGQVKHIVAKKIKDAPVPSKKELKKMTEALEKAKMYTRKAKAIKDTVGVGKTKAEVTALTKQMIGPRPRTAGESRGNSKDRSNRARNLFTEFGGDYRGYVVCHISGIKMHHTDDPKENPHGYPKFEQSKIFVTKQGGGSQLANLIPEARAANRSRNASKVRKENQE